MLLRGLNTAFRELIMRSRLQKKSGCRLRRRCGGGGCARWYCTGVPLSAIAAPLDCSSLSHILDSSISLACFRLTKGLTVIGVVVSICVFDLGGRSQFCVCFDVLCIATLSRW